MGKIIDCLLIGHITLKLKEDFRQALKITAEILKEDPNYRDGRALFQELRSLVGQ